MTRFFANANYDFIGMRRKAFLATAVLLALGLVALLTRQINYSIEFEGGTLIEIDHPSGPVNVQTLRDGLTAAGVPGAEITPFGDGREVAIRAAIDADVSDADNTELTATAVLAGLDQVLGPDSYEVTFRSAVGPKVGGELRTKAFLAVLLSFGAVLLYLAYRFEWRFGLAAVVATGHDIILTVCFIAVANIEVSLVVVAAILSMVGYSLNDTIIIFDRIRENLQKPKRDDLVPTINRSINETLPRSVLTHATTLAALLALIVFGGDVIRPFALVMAFGVFTGTFSSIFIASPVLLIIEDRWPGMGNRTNKAMPVKPRSATQPA